jgi:hypothetical protein
MWWLLTLHQNSHHQNRRLYLIRVPIDLCEVINVELVNESIE